MVHIDLFDRGVLANVTHHNQHGYLITLVPDGESPVTMHVDFRVLDTLARQSQELRPEPASIPGLEPAPTVGGDILDRLRTGYAEEAHQ